MKNRKVMIMFKHNSKNDPHAEFCFGNVRDQMLTVDNVFFNKKRKKNKNTTEL